MARALTFIATTEMQVAEYSSQQQPYGKPTNIDLLKQKISRHLTFLASSSMVDSNSIRIVQRQSLWLYIKHVNY
jgi:hypothetical protein